MIQFFPYISIYICFEKDQELIGSFWTFRFLFLNADGKQQYPAVAIRESTSVL